MARLKKSAANLEEPVVPKGKDAQENGSSHRADEDQERDKAVYQYLLSLTDLGRSTDGKPNESSIAKQWGLEKNRIFVRRVLRSVYSELYPDEAEPTVPGLTLGKLVKILVAIKNYRAENRQTSLQNDQTKLPRILTRAEKLRALRRFFRLATEERKELELPAHEEEALLLQLMENVTDPAKGFQAEDIRQLYERYLLHAPNNAVQLRSDETSAEDHREELIRYNVRTLIADRFEGLDEQAKAKKLDELTLKVQREISRIEFQSGLKQGKQPSGAGTELDSQLIRNSEFLTRHFIQRLTRSIVENESLTDEFPIFLKYFTAEKVHPLPLYFQRRAMEETWGDEQDEGLLNPTFTEAATEEDISGLERQYAYKVRVHFYIKLAADYQPKLSDTQAMILQRSGAQYLHFYEEINGVGSILSLIIAAINRLLLWDIPVLNTYMPVAQEVWLRDDIRGGSSQSSVWSHTLVRLCNQQAVDQAVRQKERYEEIANDYELAPGEYCGFDLVEVAAKAALHARIRAIKQAGVDPSIYLTQLCHRVEELNVLIKAKELLRFYPFSLRAMEGKLNSTLFAGRYRQHNAQCEFQEKVPIVFWSMVAYEAHLALTDAYLEEGLYRIAKRYLDVIEPHIRKFKSDFSSLTLGRYYLCQFKYHYLTDLEDEKAAHPDRYRAIRSALKNLDDAEYWLDYRLERYEKIGELRQTNFRPFFHLFSKIYAYRAKLYIFYASYMEETGSDRWDSLIQPIRLLEKARICAARDGNASYYAFWSAYQSWCYVMAAFLGGTDPLPKTGFERKTCLTWARKLVDHMTLCYSSTGKRCYQQIKDNGGKDASTRRHFDHEPSADQPSLETATPTPVYRYYDDYGGAKIHIVPLIQELWVNSSEKDQTYDHINNVVTLDTALLKKIGYDAAKSTYLFGTYSSMLLFATGMLDLCDDYTSDADLLTKIGQAARLFNYCWATAEDGGVAVAQNQPDMAKDAVYVDRVFEKVHGQIDPYGDSLIRGLYPHRLTEFADLGRIFVAVCKLLTIVACQSFPKLAPLKSKDLQPHIQANWEGIHQLLQELTQPSIFYCSGNPDVVLGQKRYNGHLAEHYKKIHTFFANFEQKLKAKELQFESLQTCRDLVVTELFHRIRNDGQSGVAWASL